MRDSVASPRNPADGRPGASGRGRHVRPNATILAFGSTKCQDTGMVLRSFWHRLVGQAWRRRSVVWLMGVRRAGKTFLSQSLPAIEYFDCELPRVRRQLEDPEAFLGGLRGKRIVLDEIHRLPNPAEVLKIAADHFPHTRVLATGSSRLATSARFGD